MAEIELRNVTKRFAHTTAVKHASVIIHDGEFFILVGPSGCGKSTLLNMIVGLEDVTEGEIRVDGKRVNDLDPKHRNMAMVFQSYAIYPHMTVRGNMSFPLKLAKLSEEEIRKRVGRAAPGAPTRRRARPQAPYPFRWPASTRSDGPCHRARTRGVPAR